MMKVLLIPTTEGFGHVSRTLAIIRALEISGSECHILTDINRARFLIQNGISPSKIDTSFYGISYVYRQRNGNCNLNMLCTIGKVIVATPFYLKDICSVLYKVLKKERYDLIINDLTLHLARIPGAKVLNIGHYTLFRSLSDIKRMVSDMHCLWYEGIIEPVINFPITGSHRFWMDLRSGLIDNERFYPPIVSPASRTRSSVRKDLGIPNKDRLILDGRAGVSPAVYRPLTEAYEDIYVCMRSSSPPEERIITSPFIPGMVNYLAAADLFITNPGFSSISEGAVCGVYMGFNHPGNHAEQRKNLSIACAEGYGDEIKSWDADVITLLDKKNTKPPLPNGLPFLIEKVRYICS